MFDYSSKELTIIDSQLDPLFVRAAKQDVETQQLALDATRLLSCTYNRLDDYKDKGFFKRCWSSLSGKTNSMIMANQNDLIEMQKISWRYLTVLQERDLMLAHSIITVKNNLLTLAVKEEETRKAVIELADRISLRFTALEERVDKLEVATNIHSWLLTLSTYDYEEKFQPYIRLLRIVRDFYKLKPNNWTLQEIKYLQKAIDEVGLDGKSRITIGTFISGIIDEIEDTSVDTFRSLVCLSVDKKGTLIPSKFVLEEIAVPFYASLARIEEDYDNSMRIIKVLAKQLSISSSEAHKQTLMAFVEEDGIDITVTIPLRDLAVELLACMSITEQLFRQENSDQLFDSDINVNSDKADGWEVFNRGRFSISQKTMVIQDKKTGLDWLVGPDIDTTHYQAQNWVDSLGNGWRLPSLEELEDLDDSGIGMDGWDDERDCAINPHWGPFENSGVWIWSNEIDPSDSSSAWFFDFDDGDEDCYDRSNGNYLRAFAVRSRG